MISLSFAGTLRYRDHWKESQRQPRVILDVRARDRVTGKLLDLDFLVDTGSQWGIVPRQVADQLQHTLLDKRRTSIVIAGQTLSGDLCEMQLALGIPPDEIFVDAKLLVVDDEDWDGPNVLGLSALQSFTWALEPTNLFHYRK